MSLFDTLEHPPISSNRADRQAAAQTNKTGAISDRPDVSNRSESALDHLSPLSEGSYGTSLPVVRAGFMPLVDCAPLVVASRLGFDRAEGISLQLVRETSWANIRDKVVFGHFDVAHMLAAMPIAATLGIGHVRRNIIAPCALGLGGNAITVSTQLWAAMVEAGANRQDDPAEMAQALKRVVDQRRNREPLTFGMVHPFSTHNYELRYFLASAGIHPDRDVRLVVVPPPLIADALSVGEIDGFCVGAPWNSLAADLGLGRIIATKAQIWRSSPCKVLGARESWALAHPDHLSALIRAVYKAAQWCEDPANHQALAMILAEPDVIGVRADIIARTLSGQLVRGQGEAVTPEPDFMIFGRNAATFPWHSHGLWFYSQMVRWGQVRCSADILAQVGEIYRPDLYRAALSGTDAPLPNTTSKVEGALTAPTAIATAQGRLTLGPDGFFDGRVFDPEQVLAYIQGFKVNSMGGV